MLNKNFGTYNWLFWPQMPRSHFLKRKIILINIVVHATYVINDELMTKLLRERKPSRNKDVIFSATARAHNQIKSNQWRHIPIEEISQLFDQIPCFLTLQIIQMKPMILPLCFFTLHHTHPSTLTQCLIKMAPSILLVRAHKWP